MTLIGIIIPALNPDQALICLTQDILTAHFALSQLVIVDDGSDAAHQPVFDQLTQLKNVPVTVLHNAHNLGKGAALKIGFQFFADHFPTTTGVATLDADGQHTVEALSNCLHSFAQCPDHLILGVRRFTNNVPFRSQFGNRLTSWLVRIIAHQTISDTQTGLRVIPMAYVRQLLHFTGDHFEFEFEMLLGAQRYQVKILEQPIPTIYIDGNQSSHFRVIHDSLAIYAQFFKFAASSLASFAVDIVLFEACLLLLRNSQLHSILIATLISRCLSAVVNYGLNRHLVFNRVGHQPLFKYATLFLSQMAASGYLTWGLTHFLAGYQSPIIPLLSKIVVDIMLFFISYRIQRDIIFSEVPSDVHL
ncbi:glycosyltransferase [Lacticaseibacillus paracasei]|jgi:glycosyltransferase involved in cell wall biosynthesis|uniref:bifunctional glycosyltransferase family 2/GtrA family protein n=1 Tax=Lacticaseibacillus paracasei TaxID=1597 RepID=UPI0021A5B25B|nr:bifunctional glycosyltransferase family 2/GtrA family protein [Lacticaseibacillus paracasei]MCT3325884.1 glycosyltransferase [Lacticaseibacillus paracasei]